MTIPSRAAYQVTSDTDPPGYAPGYWYTIAPTTAVASAAASVNVLRAYPWIVRKQVRIQAIGARVATGAAGLAQIAIYRANATTLLPMNAPLATTGDIDVSVAQNVNGVLQQGIVTVGPGLHYMAYVTNIAMTWQGGTLGNTVGGILIGASSQAGLSIAATSSAIMQVANGTFTYGSAWPDANSLGWQQFGTSNVFLGQFQVAS